MELFAQVAINSLIIGAFYALLAVSFNLIFSVSRFFNFAHGSWAVISGYMMLLFFKFLGWNLYLSIVLALVITGLSGYLLEKSIFLPLRRRKASSLVILVASLGAFTAIQALFAILFGNNYQTVAINIASEHRFALLGAFFSLTQGMNILLGLAIPIVLMVFLKKSSLGRKIKAVGDDEEVAKIVGINSNRVIAQVFVIGSVIVGIAGVLSALDTGVEPILGLRLLVSAVIAAIVGGLGTIGGGMLGGFLVGFAENIGIIWIPSAWKGAISLVILMLFLIFRPRGIIQK